jgi:hypothetical protein
MAKIDYVVLWQPAGDNRWKLAETVEARNPQLAIESVVLTLDDSGLDAAGEYVAIPKRYWRPVPRRVESVKTVVGG